MGTLGREGPGPGCKCRVQVAQFLVTGSDTPSSWRYALIGKQTSDCLGGSCSAF